MPSFGRSPRASIALFTSADRLAARSRYRGNPFGWSFIAANATPTSGISRRECSVFITRPSGRTWTCGTGAVSLIVGFLLVATLVTVSVNERLGEIVVMRAIGVARSRVVQQIVLEGTAIMIVGAIVGLGLGLITARYLNSILASFPGLPAAIDFFKFEPRDAWMALGMLVGAGILAGVYPSWRGASRPAGVSPRHPQS